MFKGILGRKYSSPAAMLAQFRKWRKKYRREKRGVYFICMFCHSGLRAFTGCKIKEVFCGECGRKMLRARGFFCDIRPELRKCDGCGYYDESGTYRSYRKYDD